MDLIAYLEELAPLKLSSLYDSPYTCQAVLRSLPPLAKQYVVRLLFLDSGIPEAVVTSWALPSAASKHEAALRKLQKLQLLTTLTGRPGEVSYMLSRTFQQQLRAAVCTGMSFQSQPVPSTVLEAVPAREAVDSYALSQWERLLLFVVGSTSQPPAPPQQLRGGHAAPLEVTELLLSAGLVLRDDRGRKSGVSESGFQFLLMDTYHQLWALLRQYITSMEQSSSAELSSAISFLLQLGAQGQRPLDFPQLPPLEQAIATHMAQLGLLAPFQSGGSTWLQPTRLAALLAAKPGASGWGSIGAGGAGGEGFVIVETNYRVYAYTTSPVQQSILRLFVRCDALLPNLFVGTLTRESVKAALEVGISAEQVVSFLRQHAHPRVAARVPVVPLVVAEQVQLWEKELRRLRQQRATMYSNFETPLLYQRTAAFAAKLGAVLFRKDESQQLVVRADAHEHVRAEIRKLKQQLGA